MPSLDSNFEALILDNKHFFQLLESMRFGGSLMRIRQSARYYRGSSVKTDETPLFPGKG